MVTQATREACEAYGGDKIVFRSLGRIQVAGRREPVPIHEIAGIRAEMSAEHLECLNLFDQGLASYHAQEWERASEFFTQSADL